MNKFDRKLIGKGAVRTWKGFTLSISNEDISDIIKIIKSLEDSGVWGGRGVRRAERGYMDRNF